MDGDDVAIGFVIIILTLFIFFLIGGFAVNSIGKTDGEHTGYVTAVEHNENIIWPANIVYFKTDFESTQEDKYCVNDKNLMNKLKQLAITKSQVTIKYSNPFLVWNSICNGGESIIVSAE